MTDDVWKRDEIESPCVQVCVVHPHAKLCIGCYRSTDEIRVWSRLDSSQRRRIMAELPARAPLVKGRRKGGRRRNPD